MFSVSGGKMKETKQTHVVQLYIFICTELKAYKLLILPAVIIMWPHSFPILCQPVFEPLHFPLYLYDLKILFTIIPIW